MPFEPSDRHSRLPQVLLGAYLCALVYGSLYPWTGWRALGGSGFGFLGEPWPRYWTWFDVLANVVVYAPLGALGGLLVRRRFGAAASMLVATAVGALISLVLEAGQSFVPGRVPSRLDWLANAAGAALGASAGELSRRVAAGRRSSQRPGAWTTKSAVGPALLAAWLAIQMHPQRLLFGNGDVVAPALSLWLHLFGDDATTGSAGETTVDSAAALADALRLDADYTVLVEATGTASAIVALGMLVREMFPSSAPRVLITGALLAAAALVRAATSAALFGAPHAFSWLTAGAQGGLAVGVVVLSVLAAARRGTRLWICIGAIALTAALTCVFPVDPYYASALGRWDLGAWRNFTGLLEGAALLWPFVAIAWCAARLAGLRADPGSIIRGR